MGGDIPALFRDFSIVVVNAFDTQEASGCLGRTGVGLAALLDLWGCPLRRELAQLKDNMKNTDWRLRPMTLIMLQYATLDVHYLVSLYKLQIRELLMSSILYPKIEKNEKNEFHYNNENGHLNNDYKDKSIQKTSRHQHKKKTEIQPSPQINNNQHGIDNIDDNNINNNNSNSNNDSNNDNNSNSNSNNNIDENDMDMDGGMPVTDDSLAVHFRSVQKGNSSNSSSSVNNNNDNKNGNNNKNSNNYDKNGDKNDQNQDENQEVDDDDDEDEEGQLVWGLDPAPDTNTNTGVGVGTGTGVKNKISVNGLLSDRFEDEGEDGEDDGECEDDGIGERSVRNEIVFVFFFVFLFFSFCFYFVFF